MNKALLRETNGFHKRLIMPAISRGAHSEGGRLISYNELPFLPQSWKSNMGPSNGSYLSNTAISHFHDHPVKPLKTNMSPNKADYFSREYIFQPLIFRKNVSFQGSILFPLKLVKLWRPHKTSWWFSKGHPLISGKPRLVKY